MAAPIKHFSSESLTIKFNRFHCGIIKHCTKIVVSANELLSKILLVLSMCKSAWLTKLLWFVQVLTANRRFNRTSPQFRLLLRAKICKSRLRITASSVVTPVRGNVPAVMLLQTGRLLASHTIAVARSPSSEPLLASTGQRWPLNRLIRPPVESNWLQIFQRKLTRL